jgi:hypothetical protein
VQSAVAEKMPKVGSKGNSRDNPSG